MSTSTPPAEGSVLAERIIATIKLPIPLDQALRLLKSYETEMDEAAALIGGQAFMRPTDDGRTLALIVTDT